MGVSGFRMDNVDGVSGVQNDFFNDLKYIEITHSCFSVYVVWMAETAPENSTQR